MLPFAIIDKSGHTYIRDSIINERTINERTLKRARIRVCERVASTVRVPRHTLPLLKEARGPTKREREREREGERERERIVVFREDERTRECNKG